MKYLKVLHWTIMGCTMVALIVFIAMIIRYGIYVEIIIPVDTIDNTEIIESNTELESNIPINTPIHFNTYYDTELPTESIIIIRETETEVETEVETEIEETVEETTAYLSPIALIDMYEKYNLDEDAILLAKIMWTEAGGIKSTIERACVAWTVLNRVDKYHTSVRTEITKPYQFAWRENAPVYDDLLELAYDVLARWYYEKETGDSYGRVLPANYIYFYGDGRHNYFYRMWENKRDPWDYSLPSPYAD